MHNVRLLNSTVYIIQSERGPGVLDRACEQLFGPWKREFEQPNFQMFKARGGGGYLGKGELIGVLKCRIDRCISTCSLPQCTEQHLNTYTVAVSEEF